MNILIVAPSDMSDSHRHQRIRRHFGDTVDHRIRHARGMLDSCPGIIAYQARTIEPSFPVTPSPEQRPTGLAAAAHAADAA